MSYSQNEKWNTTLYYLPNFTLDYSSKKSLDYAEENETVIYPSSSNQQQYAIRSVYVGDRFNAGITLFKGFEVIRDNFGPDIYEPYNYRLTVNNAYRFLKKDWVSLILKLIMNPLELRYYFRIEKQSMMIY